MKKEFIEIGKIVGTHGVRGMVRIQPWADNGEFLCSFDTMYTENGIRALNVETAKPHGNVVIAQISGISSIEDAEKLRGKILLVKREDAYFVSELIGCKVSDSETGLEYGEISDVSSTGANDVWHIKKNGKEYLLPAIDQVVKTVDIEKGTVTIAPMKGLFDDENGYYDSFPRNVRKGAWREHNRSSS